MKSRCSQTRRDTCTRTWRPFYHLCAAMPPWRRSITVTRRCEIGIKSFIALQNRFFYTGRLQARLQACGTAASSSSSLLLLLAVVAVMSSGWMTGRPGGSACGDNGGVVLHTMTELRHCDVSSLAGLSLSPLSPRRGGDAGLDAKSSVSCALRSSTYADKRVSTSSGGNTNPS